MIEIDEHGITGGCWWYRLPPNHQSYSTRNLKHTLMIDIAGRIAEDPLGILDWRSLNHMDRRTIDTVGHILPTLLGYHGSTVDEVVARIADETFGVIMQHSERLDAIADHLEDRRRLSGRDFYRFMRLCKW